MIVQNSDWEVLTPTGWQDFDGVKRTTRKSSKRVEFSDGSAVTATSEHLLLDVDKTFRKVETLNVDDQVMSVAGLKTVTSIVDVDVEQPFYDLIEVRNGHEYYTNDVVSHNCHWIRDFDSIWTGLYPTLSTGGSAILLSTPNGVGGQYYKIWTDGKSGVNDFNCIELPWDVHPEHDQAWFDKETRGLSQKQIAQEFLCSFISSGDTFLQTEEMKFLYSLIMEPAKKGEIDKNFWVWDDPRPSSRYIISGDVSRGNSSDFSACHVIELETLDVVAEYMGAVPPDKLADLMMTFGRLYNDALLAPENNSFGWFTACRIRDQGYPRLYYEKAKGNIYDYKPSSPDEKPGFSTQTNSRQVALAKLEEAVRNKRLTVHSQRTYDQLRTFVWQGSKAMAQRGYNDDLVMSLAIGTSLAYDNSGDVPAPTNDVELTKAMLRATSVQKRESTHVLSSIDDRAAFQRPRVLGTNQTMHHFINNYNWLLK